MSLAILPWWAFAAGILPIAGVLYVLQRLRSERRFVAFAAASLWARMPRATPYRVRGAAFRYRLAYLLSLTIAVLLWLAVANPVAAPPAGGGSGQTFYFDATAVLTPDNAAAARRALMADVRATPAQSRTVVLGDAVGTPLLLPGESVSLLSARLDAVDAAPRPSTFGAWLREHAPTREAPAISYYGGWGTARAAAAGLPLSARLRYGYLAPPVPDNRGIVTLGASPAASGRAGKADVLIGVAGATSGGQRADDVVVEHDGTRLATPPERLAPGRFLVRDIDADGGALTVALRDGDGFAADDRASLILPDRRPIKVAFGSAVPATIRAVVRADEGVTVAPLADADVVIRTADDATDDATPALMLTTPAAGATFIFTGPTGADGGALSARLGEFGLDQVDAGGLADRLGRPIALDVRQGDLRSIAVWAALFDPAAGFARSAAMPLFVSQAIRWLAGERSWTPYAKAGAPLPARSMLDGWGEQPVDADGRSGGATVLGGAGRAQLDGRPVAVSLTDPATTTAVGAQPPQAVAGRMRSTGWRPPNAPFAAMVLLVLAILVGEWIAYQRGRIP